MDCFELVENKLYVHYEPTNDLELFSEYCVDLLHSSFQHIYLIFDSSVSMIHSLYVGAIIHLAVASMAHEKTLHIRCSDETARWLRVMGGECLEWIINDF